MADINPNALLEFAKTITSGGQSKGGARLATVTRVDENGTAYVQLPGGNETPIATTGAMYNIGDVVSVSMYGGKLRTVDNITAPSVSERIVRAAVRPVSKAAELAKKSASEAEAVANAVNQHFWDDDNGAHVTDVTKDEWKKAVEDEFSDLSDDKQYSNVLLNSLGMLLRSALNNLVSITRSAIAFYDGLGNAAANVVAQFGKDGAQIGYADESHLELDYHSLQLVDKEGATYFHVSDLRGADGTVEITDVFTGTGATREFHLSYIAVNTDYTVTVDDPSGSYISTPEKNMSYVYFSTAPSAYAVITVVYRTASDKVKAYTLGIRNPDADIGTFSVAEGYLNEASAIYSHAEGYTTIASGYFSHSQNYNTVAASAYQTALGVNNAIDENGTYALIIGNGTSSTRHNALAVKWSGETVHGTDITTYANNDVITVASGITINTIGYSQWGRLAQLVINFKPTSAKSGTWTIGQLKVGRRPVFVCRASGVNDSSLIANVLQDGTVQMGGSVAANTSKEVGFTYLLA